MAAARRSSTRTAESRAGRPVFLRRDPALSREEVLERRRDLRLGALRIRFAVVAEDLRADCAGRADPRGRGDMPGCRPDPQRLGGAGTVPVAGSAGRPSARTFATRCSAVARDFRPDLLDEPVEARPSRMQASIERPAMHREPARHLADGALAGVRATLPRHDRRAALRLAAARVGARRCGVDRARDYRWSDALGPHGRARDRGGRRIRRARRRTQPSAREASRDIAAAIREAAGSR